MRRGPVLVAWERPDPTRFTAGSIVYRMPSGHCFRYSGTELAELTHSDQVRAYLSARGAALTAESVPCADPTLAERWREMTPTLKYGALALLGWLYVRRRHV